MQRSSLLLGALTAANLGALVIMLTMPLPAWPRVGIAILILASMTHTFWHHWLRRSRYAVIGLSASRDGLKIETRTDGWMDAEILGSSFVSPWLTVLNLKLSQRRLPAHVVLLPDMLDHDEFRRLRVWLKWGDVLTHGKDSDAVL